ncbi:porin [Robbsia sp. KACC 23696]|uniref:porin n=1 Tax=Robbsia sp. KACC 23696 TaxID=3149231 RepID=UPI00325BB0B4
MKRTGLMAALAVSAATFSGMAQAQSSVTLYGLIDVGLDYSSDERTTAGGSGGRSFFLQSGNINPSRWGLRGSEDLGDGLSAIFTLENGFNVGTGQFSNGSDEFGRQAFVGLRSERFGQVTLGRQYDAVSTFVAPMSAAGSFAGNLASHPFDSDNMASSTRMNNAVMLRSADFHGFQFGGGYAFSNTASGFRQNNAFTFGGQYVYAGLSVAAAFFQANQPGGLASGNTSGALSSSDVDAPLLGQRQRIYAGGIAYAFEKAKIGFVASRTSIDGPTEINSGGSYAAFTGNFMTLYNYELNGRYALTPALSLGGAVDYTQGHYVQPGQSQHPKWVQGTVQVDYALSQRTDVYLEGTYQHVSSASGLLGEASIYHFTPSNSNRQAIVSIGMRTRF